jgi:hypothetical protein
LEHLLLGGLALGSFLLEGLLQDLDLGFVAFDVVAVGVEAVDALELGSKEAAGDVGGAGDGRANGVGFFRLFGF